MLRREAMRVRNEARRAQAALEVFTCGTCGTEKLRGNFWPLDVTNRHRRMLACKTCRPTPPCERRKQGQPASSSSMPGPSEPS
eukprot:12421166-Karenia_brevis.AAC.1